MAQRRHWPLAAACRPDTAISFAAEEARGRETTQGVLRR
jgi:hypothetical protein